MSLPAVHQAYQRRPNGPSVWGPAVAAGGCERERRGAERLWTEMGAHGHIERMDRDLAELNPDS